MKNILIVLTLIISIQTNGQSVVEVRKDNNPNKIYSKVDMEAVYPGGDTAWKNYLDKNLKISVIITNGAPKGRYFVSVKFIVNKDGSLADVYCENDPGYGMCQESLNIIKRSLKWVPAKVQGQSVTAYHRQPINFQIE